MRIFLGSSVDDDGDAQTHDGPVDKAKLATVPTKLLGSMGRNPEKQRVVEKLELKVPNDAVLPNKSQLGNVGERCWLVECRSQTPPASTPGRYCGIQTHLTFRAA